MVSTIASRENAAKVLPEADARFFRDAGCVGIYSLEKTPNFLLNLSIDDVNSRIARRGDLPWLELVRLVLVLHFRLHPLPSPKRRPALSL